MGKHIVGWALVGLALLAAGCDAPHMKATPFYTGESMKAEGPVEDRVNLWPIAYYRKPALSVLWPFAELTDDHAALRPLLSVYKLDKERQQWNVAWPLAQFDFDTGEHHVFPVFWGEDELMVFPVVFLNWDTGDHVVVPFGWGKDHFVAFPLVWWYEDIQGVFPAFWWDKGVTVFPLYWQRDGAYCHLLPLWCYFQEAEGTDTHVLWPLFRRLDTKEKQGWRLWPFVGHYVWEDGYENYALWPLAYDRREGDERGRLAFPIYFAHSEGDEGMWLVLPAAFHSWDGEDRLTLTPLWAAGREGRKRWDAVVPLYYRTVNEETDTRSLITPIIAHEQSPKGTEWVLLPLLSSLAWGEGETELWAFAPLVHARWGGEHAQHHVLPLYYYDGAENLFLSLLYSRQSKQYVTEETDGFVNVGVLLGHYAWEKDGEQSLAIVPPLFVVTWDADDRDVWLPWPLVRYRIDGQGVLHHLFPLYSYEKGKDGSLDVSLLVWAGGYARTSDGAKEVRLPLTEIAWDKAGELKRAATFPLYTWKRREWEHVRDDWKDGKKTGTKTQVAGKGASFGAPQLFRFVGRSWDEIVETPEGDAKKPTHTRRTDSNWAWPLWSYESKRDTYEEGGEKLPHFQADASLLWWLYDWKRREGTDFWDDNKPHDYVRSRILWRAMHYERLDGDRSLDVFPFITWDRKADGGRQFSFFWRLFRSERKADGGRELDVLFVPVVRREGGGGR